MGDKLPSVRNDSYGLPGIINTPFNVSAVATNIKTEFPVTAIFRYNRNVFPVEEILSFYVTSKENSKTNAAKHMNVMEVFSYMSTLPGPYIIHPSQTDPSKNASNVA